MVKLQTLTGNTGELRVGVFRCTASKETPDTSFHSSRSLWAVVHGCKRSEGSSTEASRELLAKPIWLTLARLAMSQYWKSKTNDGLLDSPTPTYAVLSMCILNPKWVLPVKTQGFRYRLLGFFSNPWPPAARSAVKRLHWRWAVVTSSNPTIKEEIILSSLNINFISWFQSHTSFRRDK